jgi:hypothetical protein
VDRNCKDHINLVVAVKEMNKDIKWLVQDRKEQKDRYELIQQQKENRYRWKIGILSTGFLSCLGLLFGAREELRQWIYWWLHK